MHDKNQINDKSEKVIDIPIFDQDQSKWVMQYRCISVNKIRNLSVTIDDNK